jgi:hypothetical protein
MNENQLSFLREPMPPDLSEAQKARWIKTRMESERAAELEELRRDARHLVHDPTNGMRFWGIRHAVSADQVNEYRQTPINYKKKNNINGDIFQCDGWVFLCWKRSHRVKSHGNMIGIWTLEQYETLARADMAAQEAAHLHSETRREARIKKEAA